MTIDLTVANWQKSTRSGGSGECVEVALNLPNAPGFVAVRHSHRPDAEVITYTDAEWVAFLGGVRDGEFDKP
ncbi:hypothetical protein ACWT_3757 [Actinoplanes sp. SE50]|uniref:DUF397 domain-containing protein n=1 Tax=unclassified Actinoplanes TaxID=2626549 RepID=UPI00023ECB23|nr:MULTISPECIES: DUF397 domain-containing protein [unclassified Actinoplanes]AEV84780.1 hypothetical protein ACPL_3885 [Actinoplanes sp. SE50/110]ATO83172.1 hypothetical protein ACWT_3757 [Actinoplanes sp. SE50]SLM00579.1 hypothetical protein ACSP50_3812 [Actinoplanes sp. SE50/110]